jgi:hypothetical protein
MTDGSSSQTCSAARTQQILQPRRQEVRGGRLQLRRQREIAALELRQDFFGKAHNERILPPFRPLRQREHRGARLAPFADALERLVFAVFEQRIESRRQRCIIEEVAAEDREQARLGLNGASARNTKWHFGH